MKLSRREFLKLSAAAGAVIFFPWGKSIGTAFASPVQVAPSGIASWTTTKISHKWVDALPIPPFAQGGVLGGKSIKDPLTGKQADYYEMQARQSNTWQFHADLAAAPTWGYWQGNIGIGYLGPTIVAQRNKPVVLKMANNLPSTPIYKDAYDNTIGMDGDAKHYPNISRIAVHLHGGFVAPQVDGHPDSWFGPNGEHGAAYRSLAGAAANEYVYSYSNQQKAALLWYHDHAMFQTRLNPFSGLAAGYVIIDEDDTVLPDSGGLNIPKLPYDVPLIIQDRIFYDDGSMFYPTASFDQADLPPGYPHPGWQPEYFGDTPVVNGKAYPYLNVEPRRYRLRFLNGSQARFYHLALGGLPMWIIGTEGGLLPRPVPVKSFLMAPAERFDVIVDFSSLAMGSTVTLTNDAPIPHPGPQEDGLPFIPEVMKFKVSLPLKGTDTTLKPSSLALPSFQRNVPNMPLNNLYKLGIQVREHVLKETMDSYDNPLDVRINGRWFMAAAEELPKEHATEIWGFVNLTGDTHPMHTHLFMFHVLGRVPIDVVKYETDWNAWIAAGRNRNTKPQALNYATGGIQTSPPEELGLKDTVKSYPGEIVLVAGRFQVPNGSQKGGMKTMSGHRMFDPNVNGYEYVYHCHILEHEENEMMRPFVVTP